VDLGGSWRAAISNDDLRRDALSALPPQVGSLKGKAKDHSDGLFSRWEEVQVPGHWQSHPSFARSQGPVLYARRYSMEIPSPGCRRWLRIDGVFSEADVWLDGAYLGDLEGYVGSRQCEITQLSKLDTEHQLVLEVSCPPQSSSAPKRTLNGAYQAWPGTDPEWNPGGIRSSVTLRDTGPISISSLRVVCRDADEARAHLLLNVALDADANRRIRLRTRVAGAVATETEHLLAAGSNEVAWGLDIPEPALWWPRSRGPQNLTEITVEILHEGQLSDSTTKVTGLREVAWDQWICSINGKRIFLKGANLLPIRLDIANASPDEIEHHLRLVVEAGLDMVRVNSHIAPDHLYALADQMGILILQDLGLSARYARSVRARAIDHAKAAVDRLGHHPSIIMWSAHDDPTGSNPRLNPRAHSFSGRLRHHIREQLPSWNRTVLDRFIKRAVERADPTRPCVPSGGSAPHLPMLEGADSRLWMGWTHGRAHDIVGVARTMPSRVRFVAEFGAQAVPDSADFVTTTTWPQLDWQSLHTRHGAETSNLLSHCPTEKFADFEQWRRATQEHQADLIRTYVETLRRLKYQPTGGFGVFSLNSPAPLISYALVDHLGRPTLGYQALRTACSPVLVIADQLEAPITPGSLHHLRVHVVNDLPTHITAARLRCEVHQTADHWEFEGDIEADSCTFVGKVSLRTPPDLEELRFDLHLEADGPEGKIAVSNSYRYPILRL
jgi:beta-mannosidase